MIVRSVDPSMVPTAFYVVFGLVTLVTMSLVFPELRTRRVRALLACVLLVLALASAGHALPINSDCAGLDPSGWWYWLLGCTPPAP
jgi:hypothetical protein